MRRRFEPLGCDLSLQAGIYALKLGSGGEGKEESEISTHMCERKPSARLRQLPKKERKLRRKICWCKNLGGKNIVCPSFLLLYDKVCLKDEV